jgi:hypothetical protein
MVSNRIFFIGLLLTRKLLNKEFIVIMLKS